MRPSPDAVRPSPDAVRLSPDAVRLSPDAVRLSPDAVRLSPDAASPDPPTVRPDPEPPQIAMRERALLGLQRAVGGVLAPLWFPAVVGLMRHALRWRIEDVQRLRSLYAGLRREPGPLLVCANHLTLVDSAVIAWALGSPWWYLRNYSALPWNVPERRNFASSAVSRVLVYVMKCIPVVRGGDRRAIGRVLARLAWLLSKHEAVLLFPEGGRSLTGRVESERAAYGVGRLVASLPDCRVLCVYARGRRQAEPGDLPAWGETFRVRATVLRPVSEHRGMRRAQDISSQIVLELQRLEQQHFESSREREAA